MHTLIQQDLTIFAYTFMQRNGQIMNNAKKRWIETPFPCHINVIQMFVNLYNQPDDFTLLQFCDKKMKNRHFNVLFVFSWGAG